MPFQPFSAIAKGSLFRKVDSESSLLMKLDDSTAVFLRGIWVSDRLYARGTTERFGALTCVDALAETEQAVLPAQNDDPVDPRRKFWKEGDQAQVGHHERKPINIFAGLFLFSWMGVGYYYAKTANEKLWLTTDEARTMAAAEGIPFVFIDSFDMQFDPLLTRERKYAQRCFQEAQEHMIKELENS